jgi:hypothetical protein
LKVKELLEYKTEIKRIKDKENEEENEEEKQLTIRYYQPITNIIPKDDNNFIITFKVFQYP